MFKKKLLLQALSQVLINIISVLHDFYFIACRTKEDQEKNFVPSTGEEN